MAHAPSAAPPSKKDEDEKLVMPRAEPAKSDEKPRPIIGVRGDEIEDAERDPGTIAEEQRRRSEEAQFGPKQGTTEHLPPPPSHTPKK
jgi:hypothetical protein